MLYGPTPRICPKKFLTDSKSPCSAHLSSAKPSCPKIRAIWRTVLVRYPSGTFWAREEGEYRRRMSGVGNPVQSCPDRSLHIPALWGFQLGTIHFPSYQSRSRLERDSRCRDHWIVCGRIRCHRRLLRRSIDRNVQNRGWRTVRGTQDPSDGSAKMESSGQIVERILICPASPVSLCRDLC